MIKAKENYTCSEIIQEVVHCIIIGEKEDFIFLLHLHQYLQ